MESPSQTNLELILLGGSAGMLLLATAVVLFVFLYQRKLIKRKMAYQQIEDLLKYQELKSAYALIEGQDQERQRIAAELHDNLGTVLVTLKMYADLLLTENSPSEQQRLKKTINAITGQACENARSLSHKLDTDSLQFVSLSDGLNDLVRVVNETRQLTVALNFQCLALLSKELSFNLYRIVQELINNTLKHAQATRVDIEITTVRDEYVSLIYEDNGIGLPAYSLPKRSGMGLGNIALRVEKMDGTITQPPQHEQSGFTMIIEIPL